MPEVAVVVTVHHEGSILHRTLRSVERAAAESCRDVEFVLVADDVDEPTASFLRRHVASPWTVHHVQHADSGRSRMTGVALSTAPLICMIDGDDLMGPGWLNAAWEWWIGADRTSAAVGHPERVLTFDGQWLDSTHQASYIAPLVDLGEQNLWISSVAVPRALMERVPFRRPPHSDMFHEDWHWYCEVLASGARVEIVPRTCFFYRRRRSSQMSDRVDALLAPTALFGQLAQHRGVASPTGDRSTRSLVGLLAAVEAAGRRVVLRYPALLRLARPVNRRLQDVLRWSARDVPPWLVQEVREVHQIDPVVSPEMCLMRSQRYVPRGPAGLGRRLVEGVRLAGADPTHVMLVPWIKRGGADLEVLNYAEVVAERGGRPVLLATEPTDSPWADRLPDSAMFVDFAHLARGLAERERLILLAELVIQLAAPRVHIVNSQTGYRMLERYGDAVASVSRVYASVFCADVRPDGTEVGYAFDDLPRIEGLLTAIMCDNQRFLDRLGDIYAIDPGRLFVHHQPAPERAVVKRTPSRDFRVLWAGRLDRQKRPDILRAIAVRCLERELPIQFAVYGYGLLDPETLRNDLELPNVDVRGGYASFSDLPHSEFDAYLHTAQWEGLPNILLEATSVGLPLVTSNVGGIGELVADGVSGLLVDDVEDVAAYVRALERLSADPSLRERLVAGADARVQSQHSWDAFSAAVRAVPGYL